MKFFSENENISNADEKNVRKFGSEDTDEVEKTSRIQEKKIEAKIIQSNNLDIIRYAKVILTCLKK